MSTESERREACDAFTEIVGWIPRDVLRDFVNTSDLVKVRRALESYAANAWQPIETAPKDRSILLAGQWLRGRWYIQVGEFLSTRFPFVGEGEPTHWMPLPEPPQATEE